MIPIYDAIEEKINDPKVLSAIQKIPRFQFIPEEYRDLAEEDRPLPIGYLQTISQPYIVALMTQLLELQNSDRVLEIGTGSGFQTAVLAEIAREIYTIEVVKPLAEAGRRLLESLGYRNIRYRIGDGFDGWKEYAPYDAIIAAAAAETVPEPLLEQLSEGGRMVIPLGLPGEIQELWRFTKRDGMIEKEEHGLVRFVPFVRGSSVTEKSL